MIYVSYSQKDWSIVQEICQNLKEKGVQLFDDYEQLAGGEYAQELIKRIEESEAVIFFYSNNTENSTWVKREIEFSISHKKTIIPVLLTEPELDGWLNYNLGDVNWISADGNNLEEFTEKIVKVLHLVHRRKGEKPHATEYGKDEILPNTKPTSSSPQVSDYYRPKAIGCGCLIVLVLIISIIYFGFFCFSSSPSPSPKTNTYPSQDTFMKKEELYVILSFLAGGGMTFLLLRIRKSRGKNVKLSSDIASKVSIDGGSGIEIKSREVYSTHLDKGEYLIDFEDKSNNERHRTFNHTVESNESKLIFADFESLSLDGGKSIKCFIAGSKTLQAERDALRAVTCVMYNKWASKDFRILSYTFEDFERAAVIGGHQKQYNDFIANEADWALFVIDGRVGGITIEEYRIAMDSYKQNGRPKILALAKIGSEDNEDIAAIKAEINKEHQYWTDYADINSLKLLFESTLNWDLINIFQK